MLIKCYESSSNVRMSCDKLMLFSSRLQRTWKSLQLSPYQSHPQLCHPIHSTTFCFRPVLTSRSILMKWSEHRIFSKNTYRESGMTELQTIMKRSAVLRERCRLVYPRSRLRGDWCSQYIPHQTSRALGSVILLVDLLPGWRRPRRFAGPTSTWAAAVRWTAGLIMMGVSVGEGRRRPITGWSTVRPSQSPTTSCRSTWLASRTRRCGTTVGRVWSGTPAAVNCGIHRPSVLVAVHVSHTTAHSRTSQLLSLTLSKPCAAAIIRSANFNWLCARC